MRSKLIHEESFLATHFTAEHGKFADKIRWTAIASSQIPQLDYAVSGGVHCAKGVIKSILAGATAVQICSVIYQYGNKEIENMKRELSVWMEENGYESISQFKGKLNASATGDVNPFERTQFMKYYSSHE